MGAVCCAEDESPKEVGVDSYKPTGEDAPPYTQGLNTKTQTLSQGYLSPVDEAARRSNIVTSGGVDVEIESENLGQHPAEEPKDDKEVKMQTSKGVEETQVVEAQLLVTFKTRKNKRELAFREKVLVSMFGLEWIDFNEFRIETLCKAILIVIVIVLEEIASQNPDWESVAMIANAIVFIEYIGSALFTGFAKFAAKSIRAFLFRNGLWKAAEMPMWGVSLKITANFMCIWLSFLKLFWSNVTYPEWGSIDEKMKDRAKSVQLFWACQHHILTVFCCCGCVSQSLMWWPGFDLLVRKLGLADKVPPPPACTDGHIVYKFCPHAHSGPVFEMNAENTGLCVAHKFPWIPLPWEGPIKFWRHIAAFLAVFNSFACVAGVLYDPSNVDYWLYFGLWWTLGINLALMFGIVTWVPTAALIHTYFITRRPELMVEGGLFSKEAGCIVLAGAVALEVQGGHETISTVEGALREAGVGHMVGSGSLPRFM